MPIAKKTAAAAHPNQLPRRNASRNVRTCAAWPGGLFRPYDEGQLVRRQRESPRVRESLLRTYWVPPTRKRLPIVHHLQMNKANSPLTLYIPGSLGSQPLLITVKDAARRLGVSKSTVYRFDRSHGCLRFVIDGRRVFIEEASFETYLANANRRKGGIDLPADEFPPDCPQQLDTGDFRGKIGSGGQRELRRSQRVVEGHAFLCVPQWTN